MSSTKTTVITARISNEAYSVYTESGLTPKEWIEKLALNGVVNGVTPISGEIGTKEPESLDFNGVTPEFEELHFNELLEAMRRKGWSDSKIRNTVGQIRDQVLYS